MRKILAVTLSTLLVVGTGAAQLQDTGEPFDYNIVDREGDGTSGNAQTIFSNPGNQNADKSSIEVCFNSDYRIREVVLDGSHGQNGVSYEFDMFLDSGSADSTFREGTKLGDNLVFDESQVSSPFNSKKYSVNTVDVSAGCHELEFVVETATTSSSGVVNIDTDDSAGSTKIISGANSFNEFGDVTFSGTKLSEPPSTTGLGSPDTFRFGEQPEINVEASDPDVGRTANNGTYQGETLHNGNINGATYTTDAEYGEALSFDGNDFVDVGDPKYNFDDKISLGGWVKLSNDDGNNQHLLRKGDLWAVSFNFDDERIDAFTATNQKTYVLDFNKDPADFIGEWTHVFYTYDGSEQRLYVNGDLKASQSASVTVSSSSRELYLGSRFGTKGFLRGKADEIQIYNKSFTQSDVQDIYNNNKFIRDGLEGYWRFDKGSGSTAFDTHHRVSRFNTPTEDGGAVSFDGSNDYISVGRDASHTFGDENFSWSVWFRHNESGRQTFMSQGEGDINAGNDNRIVLGVTDVGNLRFEIDDDSLLSKASVSKSFNDGVWHHAVGVRDVASDELRLYVDGDLEASASDNTGSISTADGNLILGGFTGLSSRYKGELDDARVYKRSLSQNEINNIFTENKPIQEDLVAWYGFQNATGEYADTRGKNVLDYSVIPEVKLNITQDGTQTDTGKFLEPQNWYDWNEQITYKLSDAFTVTQTGLVEATVQAFDEFGLTSSKSTTSQTVTDSNPVVTLSTVSGSNPGINPGGGGAPGTFDRNRLYNVDTANDGDDVPNEQLSCTLSSGYTTFDQRTITEGDSYSVGADLRVGDTTTTATCTEQKGDANTGSSQGVTDTVKAFRIQSLSFDQEAIENTTQSFTAQFKHAEFADQATIDFNYDGATEKTVTRQLSGIDTGTVTGEVTTPLVQDANRSVPVEFSADVEYQTRTGATSTITNQTSDNQRVFRKILTSCTTPVKGVTGPQAQKIVLKNETEQSTRVTGDIQYDYTIGVDGSPHTRQYSFNEVGTETATTCLYPDFAEYNVNGAISYSSPGFGNRLFELQNTTFTNSSSTLPLFLLPDTEATDTIVRVQDTSSTALDRTVKVLRFDVGTNTFVTAAKLQTGNDGVAEVGLEDGAFYEFVVQNSEGQVVAVRDQERFRAQTVPARVTLTVGERLPRFVRNQDGFTFNVEQVKNNGNITGLEATVNHDSASLQNATLKVDKNAVVGQNTICEKTVQTSASTLFCDFNGTAEGDRFSFVLSSFVQGDKFVLQTGSIDKTKGLFGINQVFAGFLVFMSLSAFGFVSPRLTVMFSTAGVVAAYTLGLLSLSLFAMASLVSVALIVTFAGERTV